MERVIPVTPRPAAGKAVALDASGKVPSTALPQQVTGRLASDATITAGTGFTAVKNATGDYTITFAAAFPAVPVVIVQNTGVEQPWAEPVFISLAAGSFNVNLRDTGNVSQDGAFQFVAIQVS